MKKKLIPIFVVFTLIVAIIPAVLVSASDAEYDATLALTSKDPATWVATDGASGELQYNLSGTSFQYRFTAEGLDSGEYSLIYYTDAYTETEDRFSPSVWGGHNGIVLSTIAVGVDGMVDTGDVSTFLGTGLPVPEDANGYYYDYSKSEDDGGTGDMYAHAHGAKIWLVPSTVLTDGGLPVQAWPPGGNWLFETDLITFEQLVSNPIGVVGGVETPSLALVWGADLPSKWYQGATYDLTVNVTNDTGVTFTGVYGKMTGWNTAQFHIEYMGNDLSDHSDCGFFSDGVYYFGPAGGDSYAGDDSKSFTFQVTPLQTGTFDIGLVLVANVADER